MAKKSFIGGMSTVLGESTPEEKAQPIKRTEITKTIQEGTYEGEVRATFIVNENKLETLKALAFWERKKLKDLLDEALNNLINSKQPELIKTAKQEFNKTKTK